MPANTHFVSLATGSLPSRWLSALSALPGIAARDNGRCSSAAARLGVAPRSRDEDTLGDDLEDDLQHDIEDDLEHDLVDDIENEGHCQRLCAISLAQGFSRGH